MLSIFAKFSRSGGFGKLRRPAEQPTGRPEDVAVELLVDTHRVALELGVDRVAAAAEVDEIEQRQVILELLARIVLDPKVTHTSRLARVHITTAATGIGAVSARSITSSSSGRTLETSRTTPRRILFRR